MEGFILTRESDGGREVFDGFGHSSRDGKLRAEPRGGFPVFRDKGGLFVVVVVVLLLLLPPETTSRTSSRTRFLPPFRSLSASPRRRLEISARPRRRARRDTPVRTR